VARSIAKDADEWQLCAAACRSEITQSEAIATLKQKWMK